MTENIVCAIAGVMAGLGTGFAGLSAAVFIAPMLISFLGVDSFSAVGIALASDILASAASALTYARHGNIDLKRGRTLMISVLISALLGTLIARSVTLSEAGESVMSGWLIAATVVLGVSLLLSSRKNNRPRVPALPLSPRLLSILSGIWVGFVCGFQGTGGGLWMLFVLNMLLRFEFKTAVGTSVCIMTFTALLGAGSHFLIGGVPDIGMLVICAVTTLVAAEAAAVAANRTDQALLKRITGTIVILSGLIMLGAHFVVIFGDFAKELGILADILQIPAMRY